MPTIRMIGTGVGYRHNRILTERFIALLKLLEVNSRYHRIPAGKCWGNRNLQEKATSTIGISGVSNTGELLGVALLSNWR